jgi:2-C-methyl-D-erythritol 4-phosphate cytidylyltransferase / 2-C-methyl-D-erythritol 2,4-cyclodiphosphate synthase
MSSFAGLSADGVLRLALQALEGCMEGQEKAAAVIVAAGRGERAGTGTEGPKQYRRIGGVAILCRTIERFRSHPQIGRIVVAIHPEDAEIFRDAVGGLSQEVRTVDGGATRQESTLRALRTLRDDPPGAVLIHDGVRPFVEPALISRVAAAVGLGHGALPALPVADTLKRSQADGTVAGTVDRSGLHAAQTPQGFPYQPILEAHEKAFSAGRMDFTDDAAIAEWAGLKVSLVLGSSDNLKLTYAHEIESADQRLKRQQPAFPDVRTGTGYDVHAFGTGDAVTLCGVSIPFGKRLSGHSDADVALHALTDALLATCGAGDIGVHFPPADPQWKGASSRLFVEHAVSLVRDRGGRIANLDVTLICEAPRIGPHREAMTATIASMTGVTPERVSVKATTNEKLGFVGREEGIAAIATASVVYPGELPE